MWFSDPNDTGGKKKQSFHTKKSEAVYTGTMDHQETLRDISANR